MINPNYYNKSKLIVGDGLNTDHFPIKDRINGIESYPYTMQPGDTIYSLADAVFAGDTSKWTVIAEINQPRHPDNWKEGDIIKLPKTVTQENYVSLRNRPSYAPKTPEFKRQKPELEIISNPSCSNVIGFNGTVSGQSISYTWVSSTGHAYFIFQIKLSSEPDWDTAPEQQVFTNTITISGLLASTSYDARVKAVCSYGGESGYATTTDVTGAPSTCAIPGNFMVENVGMDFAEVSWLDGSFTPASMYVVSYKKTSESTYQEAYVTGATIVILAGLDPATEYEGYVRKRCSATDFSSPSNTAEWTTVIFCGLPTNYGVTQITDTTVSFNATAGAGAIALVADLYIIQNGIESLTASTNYAPPQTSGQFTGLTPGATYRIKIYTRCSTSPLVTSGTIVLPDFNTAGSQFCPVPFINVVQDYWVEEEPGDWKRYLSISIFGSVGAFQYRYFVENVLKETSPLLNVLIDITASGYTQGQVILVQVRADCGNNTSSGLASRNHTMTTKEVAPPDQYVCPVPIIAVTSSNTSGDIVVTITPTSADDVRYIIGWRVKGSTTWNDGPEIDPTAINPNNGQPFGYDYPISDLVPLTTYEIHGYWICHDTVSGEDVQSTAAQIDYQYNPAGGGGACAYPPFMQVLDVLPDGCTVSWVLPDSDVAGFVLQIIEASTGDVILQVNENVLTASTTSYVVTGLTNLTNYVARLQTACASGGYSPFNEGLPFTTNDTGGGGGGGGEGNPEPDPVIVDAGPAQELPSGTTSTTLTGTATPPSGVSVQSVQWQCISFPVIAPTITTPTQLTTGVTGLQTGEYVFLLIVTDNLNRQTSDSVIVTVGGGAPDLITVNAGADQSLPSGTTSTSVTGSLTVPSGVTVASTTWTVQSAPNTPGIANPSNLTTNITGLTTGVTVLRLTAVDNLGRSTFDTLQISVALPPEITVNAGDDQSLPNGTTSTTLEASLTIPPGVTVTTQVWTEE